MNLSDKLLVLFGSIGLIFSFVYSVIGAVVILYLYLSGQNMIAEWIMLGTSLIITVGSSVAAIVIGSRNSGRK